MMNDFEKIDALADNATNTNDDFSKIDNAAVAINSKANILSESLSQAKTSNPDQEKEYQSISSEFGMPLSFVRDNYADISGMIEAKKNDPKKFVTQYPSASSWFSVPENSNISSDSITQLQQYERLLTRMKNNQAVEDSGGLLAYTLKGAAQRSSELLGNLINISEKAQRFSPSYMITDQLMKAAGGGEAPVRSPIHEISDKMIEYGQGGEKADFWAEYKGDLSDVESLSKFVFSQGITSLPDAVAVATSFPLYYAARVEEGAQSRAENKGLSEPEIADYGISAAYMLASSLLEKIGAKGMLGSFLTEAPAVTVKGMLKEVGKSSIKEAGTEFLQEITEYTGETAFTNKDLDAAEGFERGIQGAVVGGPMGASVRAVTSPVEIYRANNIDALKNKLDAKMSDAQLAKEANDSITQAIDVLRNTPAVERGANIKSLSQSISDNGGPQSLSFDAQIIVDAAISADLDVSAISTELLGNSTSLKQAASAGTLITTSLSNYMSSQLALQAHESISNSMVVDDNNMSVDDALSYESEFLNEISNTAEQVRSEFQTSSQWINDITGQLVARGIDQETAEKQASIYRFMDIMTERYGVDTDYLGEFDVSVARTFADDLMQQSKTTGFEMMLDDLRNGRVPEESEYRGESLTQFVRRLGGIVDVGGEYAAIDADTGKGGFARITNAMGSMPDHMAELAHEAGYISERDPQLLLDAVEQELAGDNVYSNANLTPEMEQIWNRANRLNQLSDLLDSAEINVSELSNQEITERLNAFDSGAEYLAQQKRGDIQMDRDQKRYVINLGENFDLSTMLHESGHFFFEIMTEAYNAGKGNQSLNQDYEVLVSQLGGEAGKPLTDKQLESFAEMFEEYLREGKAPSQELAPAFTAFKIWLGNIYKQVKKIFKVGDKRLNDDVRHIMDRMLATDEEIQAANDGMKFNSLIETRPDWMTEDQFSDYQREQVRAREAQERNLNNKKINEEKKIKEKWWKEREQEEYESAIDELNDSPLYQLHDFLMTGKTSRGGDVEGDWFTLDKQATVNLMGDVFVKGGVDEDGKKIKPKLKPQMFYRKDRTPLSPELFLEIFPEFDSAFSMLSELSALPEKKRAAKAMAKINMREKYGELNTDSKLYDHAVASAHDDVVADAMLSEINLLAPQIGANTATQKIFKNAADQIIGGLKINNISPANYRRAEIKHGNLAFKAMQAGDLKAAKQEREKQLLNFHLYRNAVKVKDFTEKSFKLARSMDTGGKLKTLQKAGDHYLGQMQAILAQYEFKKLPKKALLKRQRMFDWLKQNMTNAGVGNPEIQNDVETDQEAALKEQQAAEDGQISGVNYDGVGEQSDIINYKELTPSELDAVMSMIKTVYQQAKLKDKLLTSKDKREFEKARDDLVESILENKSGRTSVSSESNKTFTEVVGSYANSFALSSRTPTSMIKEMDGFDDNGQAWQLLARPINEGEAEATDRLETAKGELERIYKDSYSDSDISKMNIRTPDRQTGRDWSRGDVVAMLLNWGNETNRMRVKDGFNLSDADVSHLFDKYLSENDFKFAGEMWSHLETYWDSAVALHKDFYGYSPEKVEALPFRTKYGMMSGGYFPISYNGDKSVKAEENLGKVKQAFQAALGTRKKMGSTQSRTSRGLNAELNLDFTRVIYGHVSDVIRQTSMQRAIYDAGRLLSDRKVAGAIREKYGPNFYKALTNAIKETRDGVAEARSAEDQFIGKIRNNATIASLGFKIKTVLMQPLGMTNSYARARMSGIHNSGIKLINETAKMTVSPISEGDRVANLSVYMKHRMISQNAEISRLSKKMKSNIISSSRVGKAYDWTKEASMIPLQKAQYYAVDVPTWNVAYNHFKGIHDKETAIQLADQFVKDAQGGGDTLDIAGSMRGSSWKKLFTNFLSYALTTYNLQAQNMKQKPKNGESDVLGKAINTVALLVAPAVLDVLLQSIISGSAPEDGEEWVNEYLQAQAGFLMGMNPISAQFSGVFSGFDYSGPQGLTLISKTGALTKQIVQGEVDDALTRSTIDFVGLATGLPSGQVSKTYFGIKDAKEKNKGLPMAVKQAAFGPER